MIAFAVGKIFEAILLILLIYCVLTWIPNINWYNEPFKTLRCFADVFFAPFRRLIPPIGMIDISPIIAFIVISILARLIVGLLITLGL